MIDDNATNRRILDEMLRGWRMRPATADGGEAGLAALRAAAAARHEPFALVLLDVVMPGMDGFEVARRIQADPALAASAVLMLSSGDQAHDAGLGRRLGAGRYLVKPVKQSDLLDSIIALLEMTAVPGQTAAAAGVARTAPAG